MTTDINFLGVAGYEVIGPTHRVLLDPFLSGSPLAPTRHEDLAAPDLILVSHAPFDHLGDAAEIAVRTGAPIVCGIDVAHIVKDRGVPEEQVCVTVPGVRYRVAGLEVLPVESRHWSGGQLSDGRFVSGPPMGFIFETEPGVRLYHYGDTAIFDMSLIGKLYKPTVGFLGCTQPHELPEEGPGELLTGEMNPEEAAMVAEMLGLKLAVCCHYLTLNEDTATFMAAVPRHDTSGTRVPLAPLPGQTIRVEGDCSFTVLDTVLTEVSP